MSHLPKPKPTPQLSAPLARPTSEGPGAAPSVPGRQPSAFDTMETRFFREGDELSDLATGARPGDAWDESTVTVKRRHGGLVSWAAVGMAAVLVSSVLAFRLASREPIPSQAVAAEPTRPMPDVRTVTAAAVPTRPLLAQATLPVPAAGLSDSPKLPLPSLPPPLPAAGTPIAQPAAIDAHVDSGALAACKGAFARHRAKDVLSECGRAFADDPSSAEVAVMLAKTELDRGRFRPALDWAKKALALDDRQADAYVFVGGAEQAAGHRAAAKSAYQHYLELAPKGRYAAELRVVLGSL